ncbi:MAG: grasp-with-spasm system SPASM domain peptide maturase [Flavobacteriaceae bacterium]|jgi:SPASM domain peptide maturase of grasp-with-spasm system|nr:grasp-with-spasm system SPASM domain peptide maturase [Flavobacteriaceae bacterium]
MFLKLFASCKVVQGFRQSIIVDVQRGGYFPIPNSLTEVIKKLEINSIENVKNEIDMESKEIFKSYITFLVNNEFGFITDHPKNFVYSDYCLSCELSINCILELNSLDVDYEKITSQLESIKTEALHVNIYAKTNLKNIKRFLFHIMKSSKIKFVSLLFMYDETLNENDLLKLGFDYPVLGQTIVYSSPFEKIVKDNFMKVHYADKKQTTCKSCSIINANYFFCNSRLYNESHHFNTCLAGKISIDAEGNIRNCPSMPQSFGNIKDTSLEEALAHPNFKKYWNITKDQIAVCKDCEFRYICTDCRAYTEEPQNIYSKPLKCGYNPYTAEWEEWSKNPIKQKAIKFYGMENQNL